MGSPAQQALVQVYSSAAGCLVPAQAAEPRLSREAGTQREGLEKGPRGVGALIRQEALLPSQNLTHTPTSRG